MCKKQDFPKQTYLQCCKRSTPRFLLQAVLLNCDNSGREHPRERYSSKRYNLFARGFACEACQATRVLPRYKSVEKCMHAKSTIWERDHARFTATKPPSNGILTDTRYNPSVSCNTNVSSLTLSECSITNLSQIFVRHLWRFQIVDMANTLFHDTFEKFLQFLFPQTCKLLYSVTISKQKFSLIKKILFEDFI